MFVRSIGPRRCRWFELSNEHQSQSKGREGREGRGGKGEKEVSACPFNKASKM